MTEKVLKPSISNHFTMIIFKKELSEVISTYFSIITNLSFCWRPKSLLFFCCKSNNDNAINKLVFNSVIRWHCKETERKVKTTMAGKGKEIQIVCLSITILLVIIVVGVYFGYLGMIWYTFTWGRNLHIDKLK